MAANSRTHVVTINPHDCPSCGVTYGLSEEYEARRRKDGRSWKCPNGHFVGYTKSDLDREREAREAAEREAAAAAAEARAARRQLKDERTRHESTRRSLSATKGVVTRVKRRVGKGVCPCCNRTFRDLARHMESKHPEYSDGGTE